jgi:hypothetical protein
MLEGATGNRVRLDLTGTIMRLRRLISGLALGAAMASPVQANGCWDRYSVEAAQIRQFDIMLMVSSLRCQLKGVEFVRDYNAFVVSNRAVLIGANDAVLRHFNSGMGGQAALTAYDRFSTAIANSFGNADTAPDCATIKEMVIAATASDGLSTRERVLGWAQQAGMDPVLAEGRCELQTAAIDPAQPVRPRRIAATH